MSPIVSRPHHAPNAAPTVAPRAYVDDRVRILLKHPRERTSRDIDDLLDFVHSSIAFFAREDLPPLVAAGLVRAASVREFEAKEVVCEQGAQGDCFYIILIGSVGVWIDQDYASKCAKVLQHNEALMAKGATAATGTGDVSSSTTTAAAAAASGASGLSLLPLPQPKAPSGPPLATKSKGDSFGELALLENQPRNATVVALVPTLLMRLDRLDYLALLKQHQDALLREKVDFLLSVDLFSNWTRTEVTALSYFFHERTFPPEAIVDEQDGIIILREGAANLVTRTKEQSMGFLDINTNTNTTTMMDTTTNTKDDGSNHNTREQQQQVAAASFSAPDDKSPAATAPAASGAPADAGGQTSPRHAQSEASSAPASGAGTGSGGSGGGAAAHLARVAHSIMPHHQQHNNMASVARAAHARSVHSHAQGGQHAAAAGAHAHAASSSPAASASSPAAANGAGGGGLVRACIVEHLERGSVFGEHRTRGRRAGGGAGGATSGNLMWSSVRYWRERALRVSAEKGPMKVLHISARDFHEQVYSRHNHRGADSAARKMDLLQLRRDALSKPPFTRSDEEVEVLLQHYSAARFQPSGASTAMGTGGMGGSSLGGGGSSGGGGGGGSGAALLGPGMKKHAFLELLSERGRRYFFQSMSIDVVTSRRIVVHQDEPAELLYVLLSGSACLFAAANNSNSSSNHNGSPNNTTSPSGGIGSAAGTGGLAGGTGSNPTTAAGVSSGGASDIHLVNIHRGDTIGELSLLSNSPYCVTVVAASSVCEWATFTRADFAHMLAAGWHPRSHMSFAFLQSMDIFAANNQQQQQQRQKQQLLQQQQQQQHKEASDSTNLDSSAGPQLLSSSASTASLPLGNGGAPSVSVIGSSSLTAPTSSASASATHPQRLIRLVYAMKYLHVGVGEVLLRQGEASPGIFFICQGKCAATTEVQVKKTNARAAAMEQSSSAASQAASSAATAAAIMAVTATSAASATHSVHHRLHAPRIKPLEVAQLSTGEQFGEGCLFANKNAPSSSSHSSSSSYSGSIAPSATFGLSASPTAPAPVLPLSLSSEQVRSSVTITTSTKCKLLYLSGERLAALVSSRTLARFRRIYALKRLWRHERIKELMAAFRTVIAPPGRAPVTPRAAAATVLRGGINAAYAAASTAIEIKPLASKQRSRILAHVASGSGGNVGSSAMQHAPMVSPSLLSSPSSSSSQSSGSFRVDIDADPAAVTPAPGGSVAANLGGERSNNGAQHKDKTENGLFFSNDGNGNAESSSSSSAAAAAAASSSAATAAFLASSAVIPRSQWRARDRVPRNLFLPTFKPVMATSISRVAVARGPGGGANGNSAVGAAAAAKKRMRQTMKMNSTTAPDGAASAVEQMSLHSGGGVGTLTITATTLAAQRWRFALSCILSQAKLLLRRKAAMFTSSSGDGSGSNGAQECFWEFMPQRANDDSFLPLPPTTFAGLPGLMPTMMAASTSDESSTAPAAATAAVVKEQQQLRSPALHSLLMDARGMDLSDAHVAGKGTERTGAAEPVMAGFLTPGGSGGGKNNGGVHAAPSSTAQQQQQQQEQQQQQLHVHLGALSPSELSAHFAQLLSRMSAAQAAAAGTIREHFDRPVFVRDEEGELRGLVAGASPAAVQAASMMHSSLKDPATARKGSNAAVAGASSTSVSSTGPAGISSGADVGAGDAVQRYRLAMLRSCALPSWVHAKLPKALASRPSKDMFTQPTLLTPPPPPRVRPTPRRSRRADHSSDEEEELWALQQQQREEQKQAAGGGGGRGAKAGRRAKVQSSAHAAAHASLSSNKGLLAGVGVGLGALGSVCAVEASPAEKARALELARVKTLWAQSWLASTSGGGGGGGGGGLGATGAGAAAAPSSSTLLPAAAVTQVVVSALDNDKDGGGDATTTSAGPMVAISAHYHGLGDVRFRELSSSASSSSSALSGQQQHHHPNPTASMISVFPYSGASAHDPLVQQAFWAEQARAERAALRKEQIEVYARNADTGELEYKDGSMLLMDAASSSVSSPANRKISAVASGSQSARGAAMFDAAAQPVVPLLLPVSVLAPLSKGMPALKGSLANNTGGSQSARVASSSSSGENGRNTATATTDAAVVSLVTAHLSIAARSPSLTTLAPQGSANDPEQVLDSVVANGGVYKAAATLTGGSGGSVQTQARLPPSSEPMIMKIPGVGPGVTERQIRWCFEGVQVEVRRVRLQTGSGRDRAALVEFWALDVPPRRVKRTVLERLARLQQQQQGGNGDEAAGDGVASNEFSYDRTGRRIKVSQSSSYASESPRFFGLDTSSSVTDRRARLLAKIAVDFGAREQFHTLMAPTPNLNALSDQHRIDRAQLASTEHAKLGADIKQLQGGHALPSGSKTGTGTTAGGGRRGAVGVGSSGTATGRGTSADNDDADGISNELSALFRPENVVLQPTPLPQRAAGAPLGPPESLPTSPGQGPLGMIRAGSKRSSQRGSMSGPFASGLSILIDSSAAHSASANATSSTSLAVAPVSSSATGSATLPSSSESGTAHAAAASSAAAGGSSSKRSSLTSPLGIALPGSVSAASSPAGPAPNSFDVSPRRASAWSQGKKVAAAAEKAHKIEMQRQASDERAAAAMAQQQQQAQVQSLSSPSSTVTGDEPLSATRSASPNAAAALVSASASPSSFVASVSASDEPWTPTEDDDYNGADGEEEQEEEGPTSTSGGSSALPSEPSSARESHQRSASVASSSVSAAHSPSIPSASSSSAVLLTSLAPSPPSGLGLREARLRSPRSARFHLAQPAISVTPTPPPPPDSPQSSTGAQGTDSPASTTTAAALRIGAAFGRRRAAL
jgi:CRP-like cAMP-binding protein